MSRKKFTIAAVYDTETCNIGEGEKSRAYPILFIDNDIRDIDLNEYEVDKSDKVNFYRHEQEMQAKIDEYIRWGRIVDRVPIICAYNLMFDLIPLMEELNKRYDIKVNAQSSTNVYTLDLYELETDNILLRFWDTYHLEMRGLAAMGRTCGLQKAVGDWDYSLIRTPETPLTEQELYYAKRDVQVIPAYLRYLLRANEWINQDEFGVRIITKTSIVRSMARTQIGRLKQPTKEGKKVTVDKMFTMLCHDELPKTFEQYALRTACFRGGFTFTSAAYASTIQHNIISADVTSMHHTFINGRFIPVNFEVAERWYLTHACEEIINTTREHVMNSYHRPFEYAIHARIRFKNIRLNKDTCFEAWGIALESSAKFKKKEQPNSDFGMGENAVNDENEIRDMGFVDLFGGKTIFAFGKLYEGETITLHLNEIELWCLSRVYEWDEMIPIFGEVSTAFNRPPDYVTLQSNMLFEQKSIAKFISEHYTEGESYPFNLSGIPDGIAEELKNGTCERQFFNEWYTNTVKGMFNGIYGTQAQNIYKGGFIVENGDIFSDYESRTTKENWEEKQPKTCRVLYTYGMRIVAGSRLHMIIALELLYEKFGAKIRVLGGDTDSIKASVDDDITDEDLEESLQPIADISKKAIDITMERIRKKYPKMASILKGIGAFEIENKGHHYDTHLELWNKARISWDGKAHVTCAGLSRPLGAYHIETLIEDLATKYPIEDVLQSCFGYDVYISNEICHSLEGHRPKATDMLDMEVTDYLGNTCHITTHESVALYPAGRFLGETIKFSNKMSVLYLEMKYGRKVDTIGRYLELSNGKAIVRRDTVNGESVIMEAKCTQIH